MVTLVTLVPVVPFRWFRSVVPGFTTCHLVEGFLEAIYLDIVEACVKILNKYESLFILALPYEKDKSD